MADIATLGFAVDSRPIQTASKSLQDLGASSEKSATQLGAIEAMAKRAGVSVQEMSRRVDAASGSTQNFQRQVTTLVAANDNFSNSLSRVNTHANGLISSFQGIAIAAAVSVTGIAGLASVFSKFITETAEAQRVQALLQASLNATGGSAGQTLDSLNNMSKALQGVSTFSDEAIGSAQNVLLRFTMVREVFERATKASLDLAAATGKDLDTAAKSVGKALEDPVRGLAAMRREGVFVTEKNQELIKSLVESGDILKAQGIILQELENRYKGAAEAARNTLGGALSGLKNAFGDLFEQSGPEADKLVASINNLTKALADPSVVAAVQAFGAAFFEELTKIISFFTNLNVEINRVKLTLSQISSGNILGALNLAGPQQKGLDELRVGAGTQLSASDATAFYKAVGAGANEASQEVKKFVGVNEAWAASAGKAGDEQKKAALTALEVMRNNVTALGSAATAAEVYQLKVAELVDKLQQGTISQDTFNRAVSQLDPTVKALRDSVSDIGNAMAQAFTQGASAAQALDRALASIAAKSTGKVIDSLLKGATGGGFDLTSIATNGLIAGGAMLIKSLFGGDNGEAQQKQQQAAAEAERQRVEREKEIAAAQIRAADYSLRAANAMEKSGFIVQIRQFDAESQRAFDEESKRAGDVAIWQLVAARAAERTKLIADTIEEATNTLAGNELSDVQQRLKDIQSAAETLGNALLETGKSAEDAAAAVADKLNVALDALRSKFVDDLARKINELAGGSWINDLSDLLKQVAQLKQDAGSLGVDPALIDSFTILSAQKIVDSAQLTGDAFARVQMSIGDLGSNLHAFGSVVEDTANTVKRSIEEIANAIQSNEDRLFNATHRSDSLADQLARFDLQAQREREAEAAAGGQAMVSLEAALQQERLNIIQDFNQQQLVAQQQAAEEARRSQQQAAEEALRAQQQAAEEQRRAIEEATKFLTGALQNIQNWIQHFQASAQSNLSPAAQLSSAQASFASQKALALGGNRDALSGITQNAQDVIDAATRYYGSSAAGQAIIANIITQLQSLPAQVSPEQFIVNGVTTSIQTQTTSLNSSLSDLQAAMLSGNPSAVAAALSPYFNSLDINTNGLLDFNEFQQGLAGMASNSALRDMFTRLDTDNSGSISRLELINQATQQNTSAVGQVQSNTQNTAQNTQTTAQNTQTTATNAGNTASNVSTGNSILQALNTNTAWLQFIQSETALSNSNESSILSALGGIQNFTGAISSWSPGSNHATGGYITGPGTGTSDSIPAMLSAGEGVIRASRVAELGGKSWVDSVNAGGSTGNDNGVTLAIKGLERTLIRTMQGLISAEFEAANGIRSDLQETTKSAKAKRFAA